MRKSPSISSGSVASLRRAQLHWRPALRIVLADLLLVLGLGLLIVAGSWWSYRQLYSYSLPIQEDGGLYRDGLGEPEETAEGWQRWAAPYTLVRFPGVGRANYRVALLFHNPLATAPRTLAIGVGNQELSRSTLQPGWQQVMIEVPAAAIDAGTGDLDFVLRITPSFKAGGRDLGVAVRSLQLHQVSAAQAPSGVQWALTLSALLLVIPLRLLGTPVRWVMLGAGTLVLLALMLLARARIGLVITLPPLNQALVLGALGAPLL